MDTPIGERLPEDVLSRRGTIPREMKPVTLTGWLVELTPLDLTRDVPALFAVSSGRAAQLGERTIGTYDPDALIWRYMYSGPFEDSDALCDYLRPLVESSNGLCLCVFDRATGRQVGVTNFLNNTPEHLRVELGSIWLSPLVQGTGAVVDATYLMLQHAFGLGYRRVEWKCNARNGRSRRAAEKMGFRLEGVLEAYGIGKGCNRDSAWFRILDSEWPDVKYRLESLATGMRPSDTSGKPTNGAITC